MKLHTIFKVVASVTSEMIRAHAIHLQSVP